MAGDFVSDSIYAIAQSDQLQTIFHVAHAKQESAQLGQLLDTAFAVFEEDETFKRRRVLKPLYADIDSFNVLAQTMTSLGQGVMSQALSSVAPFAQQLFIDKDIHNDNLRSVSPGYRAPDPIPFIRNTCQYLVDTKWGRVAEVANK